MCIICGQNQIDTSRSTAKCTSCLDRNIAKKEVSDGVCKRCYIRPIEYSRSKSYCSKCLDRFLRNAKDYRKNNTEQVKKMERKIDAKRRRTHHDEIRQKAAENKVLRISKGMCVKCGVRKIEFSRSKSMCSKCIDAQVRYGHTRRAKINGGGGSYTDREWKILVEFYGRKCLCCESANKPLTADHVVPVSRGGSSKISNIQPLCLPCNDRKMTKIIDFRPFGNAILDWT